MDSKENLSRLKLFETATVLTKRMTELKRKARIYRVLVSFCFQGARQMGSGVLIFSCLAWPPHALQASFSSELSYWSLTWLVLTGLRRFLLLLLWNHEWTRWGFLINGTLMSTGVASNCDKTKRRLDSLTLDSEMEAWTVKPLRTVEN